MLQFSEWALEAQNDSRDPETCIWTYSAHCTRKFQDQSTEFSSATLYKTSAFPISFFYYCFLKTGY